MRMSVFVFACVVLLAFCGEQTGIASARPVHAPTATDYAESAVVAAPTTQCSLLKHPATTDSPLVFLHLPKVGGTSIRDALWFSAEEKGLNMCADLKLPHKIMDERSYQPVRTCDILFGHLFFGIFGSYNAEKNPVYSVVLRDPIERVLSLYHYVMKYEEHYQHEYFANKSLHDLILATHNRNGGQAESDPSTLAVNVMTWWLCGWNCNPRYMTLSEALVRARRHLVQHIDVVGVTDDIPMFLETMQLAVPMFNDTTLVLQEQENKNTLKRTSTYASTLSADELDILHDALYADRALFRLARELVSIQNKCVIEKRQAATAAAARR